MAACSSSELQLAGESGIVMANETDLPNQNVMLNLLNGGLTNNSSKSGSTPSHASLDGKTGITYCLCAPCFILILHAQI